MYSILNDVVPFDECEVYSWFPEPEYDPHAQSDDSDASDDGLEELLAEEDVPAVMADGMEVDEPAWGQGGMELDVGDSKASSSARRNSKQDSMLEAIAPPMEEAKSSDRIRGLLWSANYFFYSK
jgi:hypothetical protein